MMGLRACMHVCVSGLVCGCMCVPIPSGPSVGLCGLLVIVDCQMITSLSVSGFDLAGRCITGTQLHSIILRLCSITQGQY